ncbi:MAG: SRPBCC domain-containing protein [Prolixibacteraceae bacterium]
MSATDFTTTFLADQTPEEVFNAVINVRGWWSEEVQGSTDKLNAEFVYHYRDVHMNKMKIVEFIPNEKVVWLVLDNYFNFTKDETEWKGTKIIFEITEKDGQTQLRFTHEGLVPQYECYAVCSDAWTSYIQGSLKGLITTGEGKPNSKEEGLSAELIEKWNLPVK